MGCLGKCGEFVSHKVKELAFIKCLIFLLLSALLLRYTILMKQDALFSTQDNFQSNMVMMFGLSIYMFAISLFGIYSTRCASHNTIKVLGNIMILNIIVGVVIFVLTYNRLYEMKENMKVKYGYSMSHYEWIRQKIKNKETEAWDELQIHKQCCGFRSPNDWNQYLPPDLPEGVLPVTCCKSSLTDAEYCDPMKQDHYTVGCVEATLSMAADVEIMIGLMIFLSVILAFLSATVILCRPSNPVDPLLN